MFVELTVGVAAAADWELIAGPAAKDAGSLEAIAEILGEISNSVSVIALVGELVPAIFACA